MKFIVNSFVWLLCGNCWIWNVECLFGFSVCYVRYVRYSVLVMCNVLYVYGMVIISVVMFMVVYIM